MEVPFDDLELQFREYADEALAAASRVMRSGRYVLTQGQEVAAFEQIFADYCGCRFAIGTSSGTAALQLALTAAGIGPGDEVVLPANTYIAGAFAITYTGARPVLVDIDPVTYNLDPERVAERITPRTRAIMPVHLYGHPAEMDALMELARQHSLFVLEDAAQAHGAVYRGRPAGSMGHAAGFSFYPTKNLGALGDAGAVTTNDPELDARVRQLRYMGQKVKYVHEIVGYQERMDELQAAFLSVKLRYLDKWNDQRRLQAAWYNELLADLPVTLPAERSDCRHVYYVYTIRAPRRDDLQRWLTDRGISSSYFYPVPIHLSGAYADLGHRPGDFPATKQAVGEILALPLFPGYTQEQIAYVADQVRAFYRQ